MKNSQRGYSLVELSIVLAIIAVVIAGSVTGAQSILRSNNVNKTITETNQAVTSIYSKYIRDVDFSGVTLQSLTGGANDVWKSTQVANAGTATATVTTSLGGKVYVAPLNADYGTIAKNSAFVYTITNIPVASCVDLALGVGSLGSVVMVSNIKTTADTAGQNSVTAADVAKDVGGNIAMATVSAKCGTAGLTRIALVVPR